MLKKRLVLRIQVTFPSSFRLEIVSFALLHYFPSVFFHTWIAFFALFMLTNHSLKAIVNIDITGNMPQLLTQ